VTATGMQQLKAGPFAEQKAA